MGQLLVLYQLELDCHPCQLCFSTTLLACLLLLALYETLNKLALICVGLYRNSSVAINGLDMNIPACNCGMLSPAIKVWHLQGYMPSRRTIHVSYTTFTAALQHLEDRI